MFGILLSIKSRFPWSKRALSLLVLGVIFTSVRYFTGSSVQEEPAPNKLVEVVVVTKQTFQQSIRLLGTIHPTHATVLVAKGVGVLDALIPTGQKISKGTLIAKIDNPDLERSLQLSMSTELLAKGQFDRFIPLLKTGYVSSKEIEEKKQTLIDAQKDVARARIELDNLRFYAPFDGVIGAYNKREGAQVNAGEAVVAIYDPASLVVDVDIPCSNIMAIHEGQTVRVLGKSYGLSHVQKMIDDESHMCPADVEIACEDCLIGATVSVDLVVADKSNALVVPSQAVFLRNGQSFVYVVEQGKVAMKQVTSGLQQDDKMEIIEGLNPGSQVISKGLERLYPELAVDIYQPVAPAGISKTS